MSEWDFVQWYAAVLAVILYIIIPGAQFASGEDQEFKWSVISCLVYAPLFGRIFMWW